MLCAGKRKFFIKIMRLSKTKSDKFRIKGDKFRIKGDKFRIKGDKFRSVKKLSTGKSDK